MSGLIDLLSPENQERARQWREANEKTCTKCGAKYYGTNCFDCDPRYSQKRDCSKCGKEFLSRRKRSGAFFTECRDCRPKKSRRAGRRRRVGSALISAPRTEAPRATPETKEQLRERLAKKLRDDGVIQGEAKEFLRPIIEALPKVHARKEKKPNATQHARLTLYCNLRAEGCTHQQALYRAARRRAGGPNEQRYIERAVRRWLSGGKDMKLIEAFLRDEN
jgi:hypothetical protein